MWNRTFDPCTIKGSKVITRNNFPGEPGDEAMEKSPFHKQCKEINSQFDVEYGIEPWRLDNGHQQYQQYTSGENVKHTLHVYAQSCVPKM